MNTKIELKSVIHKYIIAVDGDERKVVYDVDDSRIFSVLQEQVNIFSTLISNELNNFLDGQDLFANATIYNSLNRFTPLMMIKISFDEKKKEIYQSSEFIDEELKKLDKHLWEEKAPNIYFRKKLNYKSGNDIYIIRPNQRRFWSQSMALEDSSELILEILNEN